MTCESRVTHGVALVASSTLQATTARQRTNPVSKSVFVLQNRVNGTAELDRSPQSTWASETLRS